MSNVRHRLGLGTVGNALAGKNDINAAAPLNTAKILTADSDKLTADSTVYYASGVYPFTADSTRHTADATII